MSIRDNCECLLLTENIASLCHEDGVMSDIQRIISDTRDLCILWSNQGQYLELLGTSVSL
jgi:hypothetical protein